MTTTAPPPAPAQPGDYVRIRVTYPAGSPAAEQQQLRAAYSDRGGQRPDEFVARVTSIEWRASGEYWYVGWTNEQPVDGAPARAYRGRGGYGYTWLVGWDPTIGAFGYQRIYADSRYGSATIREVIPQQEVRRPMA
jgi:hypothetical protein